MAYNGTIDLISGIRQANNGTFPLVDATAVRVDDETRLDEALGKLENEVVVSDTQPSADGNKIWITEETGTEYSVPNYAEYLLNAEEIPNTVQTITFDSGGNVSTITHTANNTAVRTDTFTFADGSITEVRTLASGETLTIATDTTTLVTTVTYTAT